MEEKSDKCAAKKLKQISNPRIVLILLVLSLDKVVNNAVNERSEKNMDHTRNSDKEPFEFPVQLKEIEKHDEDIKNQIINENLTSEKDCLNFEKSCKQSTENKLGKREKRQSDSGSDMDSNTSVAGGIYKKNDPLKSYYDFVVVEGSHKFWSIFEITTAIIVIYSIFAALYFSKMNPLVSKHDYVDYVGGEDYMGGGREDRISDSGDDDDFVNEFHDEAETSSWSFKSGHSLKFILEAIDNIDVNEER